MSFLKKENIVLDIDDVLLDFIGSLQHIVKDISGIKYEIDINGKVVVPNPESWDFGIHFGLDNKKSKEIKEQIFTYGTESNKKLYSKLKAKIGAKELLSNIVSNDIYNIHFVTAIQKENKQDRIENLINEFSGIFNQKNHIVHCVGYDVSKTDVIQDLSPKYMVDDRLLNVVDCIEHVKDKFFWLDVGYKELNHTFNLKKLKENNKFQEVFNLFDVSNEINNNKKNNNSKNIIKNFVR